MQIVGARGTYETLGYEVGLKLKDAIHHNISLLNKGVAVKEIERETIAHVINRYTTLISSTSMRLMEGLSRGSGVPFELILRFNALHDTFFQEECTSFAALGEATTDGKAYLLKNRDTSGRNEFVSPGH